MAEPRLAEVSAPPPEGAEQACLPALTGLSIDAAAASLARPSDRPLRIAGLALAVAAHVLMLYAMSRQPDEAFGAGGQVLEAINVEIVTASALESRAAEAGGAAAAAGEVAESTGSVEAVAAAPAAEPSPPRQPPEEKSPEDKLEKAQPEPAAEVPAEVAAPPPPPEKQPPTETKPEDAAPKERPPQQDSSAATEASQQGGSAARGTDDTSSRASAAAAASPSVAREYGKAVLRALSRSKPKAPGGLGTVWIEFVVDKTGELAEVHVSAPSGKAKLDEAALAAVRRARLPPPPAGLSTAQLTFRIPYHFR